MYRILSISALMFVLSSHTNATLISSAADPALLGATIETFDGLTTGGTNFTFPGFSLTSTQTVTVQSGGGNCQYTPPSSTTDKCMVTSGLQTFTFNNVVSAFGLVYGAANNPHTMTAYDISGGVLDSLVIPDQVSTIPFPYSGFYGIAASGIKSFTINITDPSVYDDLHYVTGDRQQIPTPTTLALLSLGMIGVGIGRRKSKV